MVTTDNYIAAIRGFIKKGDLKEAGKAMDALKKHFEENGYNVKTIDDTKTQHSSADLDDDPVHPAHYMSYYKDGVDCLTAMKHAFGETAVSHFMICNAFKYIYRHASKGGFQDIDKAIEYLELYKKNGIIDLGV